MTTLDSVIIPKIIQPVVQLEDAAQTITAAQSGSILKIPALTANRVITMPSPEVGLTYNVVAGDTLGFLASFNFTGAILRGNWTACDGLAGETFAAGTNIHFTDACVTGDFMNFYCDGTNWYCFGMAAIEDTIIYT